MDRFNYEFSKQRIEDFQQEALRDRVALEARQVNSRPKFAWLKLLVGGKTRTISECLPEKRIPARAK